MVVNGALIVIRFDFWRLRIRGSIVDFFCVRLCLWVQFGCGGAFGSLIGMRGFVPRSARRSKHLPFDDGHTTSCSPCTGHGVAVREWSLSVRVFVDVMVGHLCSAGWDDACRVGGCNSVCLLHQFFDREWCGGVANPVGRFEAAALHGWVTRLLVLLVSLRLTMLTILRFFF